MDKENSIKRTIKFYPYFSSITSDLIFFVAIDILFLTNVKGLAPYEITSMFLLGCLMCVVFQPLLLKLIQKIGNLQSLRVGSALLCLSGVFYTFFDAKIMVYIGCICYYLALFLLEMRSNLLKNCLDSVNKSDEYPKYESKFKLLFSFYTLFAVLCGAFLFNLNSYLPMILSIIISFVGFVFSFFICEPSNVVMQKEKGKVHYKFSKIVCLLIISSFFFIPLAISISSNTKILAQETMLNFYDINMVAYLITGCVLLSRIARILSITVFAKLYKKLNESALPILVAVLLTSICLIISGAFVGQPIISYIMFAIGYMLIFVPFDPYQILIRNLILKRTSGLEAQKAISLNYTALNVGQIFFNLIATLILLGLNVICVLVVFALFLLIELFIVIKIKTIMN